MKNKKIMRDISYGMYVVSTAKDKEVGCVINTLCQITSGDNPIITISLNKENYTNQVVRETKRFAISILSEKTNRNVISIFGFQSSKEVDKFAKINYKKIDEIPVVEEDCCGYLLCEVIDIIDCETHDIFVSRVIDGEKWNENAPMTYQYYHEVLKGSAPEKAPTYEEKLEKKISEKGKEVWVCTICGYVHEGPLPDDFRCPKCGVGKEMFRKGEK